MSAARFARYCHTNGSGPHECENDCGNMLSAESCRDMGGIIVCAACGDQADAEASFVEDSEDVEAAYESAPVRGGAVWANDPRDPRQDADDRDLRAE